MLGQFIYDTTSVSDMQFQGPPLTKDQQRQAMRNNIDSFNQQFGQQAGHPTYQQPYAGNRR